MAFLRGVGNHTPQESLIYSHWITVLELFKMGFPYSLIEKLTEREITLIVGISAAFRQRETDEQERQQRISQNR
jgi:hypothetical protein